MKTREKKVLPSNSISRSEAQEALAAYAAAQQAREKIQNLIDKAMAKLREQHADELSDLEHQKDEAFDILYRYAVNNRDEFGDKKSLWLGCGVIGFRTSTPRLKTLKGFTWASTVNLLKQFLPGYVRVQEEAAKDLLLADRHVPKIAELFPKIGIQVMQEEAFFVEVKNS